MESNKEESYGGTKLESNKEETREESYGERIAKNGTPYLQSDTMTEDQRLFAALFKVQNFLRRKNSYLKWQKKFLSRQVSNRVGRVTANQHFFKSSLNN